jgi:hypothetical protein
MTNRRSFFKLLGLTAGAVATAQASPITPALPPVPTVKAKAAYVSTVLGYDWQPVKHGLNSLLVCAVAGDEKANRRAVEVENVDRNNCRVRVQKPQRTFVQWFKPKRTSRLYSLIVYVPNIDGVQALTYAQHFSVNKPRTLRLRAD